MCPIWSKTSGTGSRDRRAGDRRQVPGIEQELEMPTHLPGKRPVGLDRVEPDPAAEQHVEPQADHAGFLQGGEVRVGQAERDHRDAAQALPVGAQGLDHQPVVGAVDADLHQHAVGHAGPVEHREIGLCRGCRRRVAAVRHQRIGGRQTDDVGVGVDRARRHGVAGRTARMRVRGWAVSDLGHGQLSACRTLPRVSGSAKAATKNTP